MATRPRGGRRNDKLGTGKKNTQKDRDFIAEHARDFRVVDGHLVWSGETADIGSGFQLPPDSMRCQHTRTPHDDDGGEILGEDLKPLRIRCPNWGMLLSDGRNTAHICSEHVVSDRSVSDIIRQRALGAADAVLGRLITDALSMDTPVADRIRACQALLDRAGIRAGVEVSPDVKGWTQVLKAMMEDEDAPNTEAD